MGDWEQIKAAKKQPDEKPMEFAKRLDKLGATEVAARMRLRMEHGVMLEEAAEICGNFDDLRVREIQNDSIRHSGRSRESWEHWIIRNFPVDRNEARRLMELAER